MAQYTVFKLHFRTPLHIGLGRSSYDSSATDLHSDTLSAALAAFKAQHGASSSEIRDFLNSFAMSSAFPFEGKQYYLPRPLTADRILIDGKEDAANRKMLKSVRFIDSSVWKDFLSDSHPSVTANQIRDEYIIAPNNTDFVVPYKKQVVQRVAVSRNGEDDSDPFFFEWCFFDIGCGVNTDEENIFLLIVMFGYSFCCLRNQ
jgi:CRISPR type III-A-associated RAMP protein Csm4